MKVQGFIVIQETNLKEISNKRNNCGRTKSRVKRYTLPFKSIRQQTLQKRSCRKDRQRLFLNTWAGQIFDAGFNWVLEDGHDELKKGFQMTDAGAPEWGKFEFIVHAQKKRMNSTVTLILFETSAMDGSRQHELPIALY